MVVSGKETTWNLNLTKRSQITDTVNWIKIKFYKKINGMR